MSGQKWPRPTRSGTRPNEGNVRILRARVLDGTMTEDEARAMLNGKSPFEAQGKLPPSEASSPASAASILGLSGQDGSAASRSNGTPSASESSPSTGPMFPDLATCTTFTDELAARPWPTPTARLGTPRGAQAKRYWNPERSNDLDDAVAALGASPKSISSPAAFRVNPSPSQESSDGSRTIVGYGPSSPEPFASYDPDTSSWRTSQASLWEEGWTPYSETWPPSGTMRSGRAFPRQPLVPRTSVTGSGSSLTGREWVGRWPTPMARDHKDVASQELLAELGETQMTLPRAVARWPTPAAIDARPPRIKDDGTMTTGLNDTLSTAVMFPTPQANDNRDRGNLSMPSIQRRQALGKQLNLSMVVSPTSGALNPTWVEWLMGFPLGWTDSGPSATPSSRRSSKSSGGR